jgi:hypothetical protein
MKWLTARVLSGAGMALALVTVSASSTDAQILDRLRGRDSRTWTEEQPVERQYYYGDSQDRAYRGSEFRSGTEYRTEDGRTIRSAPRARRATTLLGSTVRIEGGRNLGRIEDIVISESGCVEFMVVSVSGLRGMMGKYAAIPFTIGAPDFTRRVVEINWSEDDLRRAPIFFSSNAWPDFRDRNWAADVFAYFDVDSSDQVGRAYREPRDEDRSRSRDYGDRDQEYDRSNRERSRDREMNRDRSRTRDHDYESEDQSYRRRDNQSGRDDDSEPDDSDSNSSKPD